MRWLHNLVKTLFTILLLNQTLMYIFAADHLAMDYFFDEKTGSTSDFELLKFLCHYPCIMGTVSDSWFVVLILHLSGNSPGISESCGYGNHELRTKIAMYD